MRRRGEVVPKTEILQHVWDSHYSGDPNVVEVYVGYLRRKIDAPFGRRGARDRARRRLPAGSRRWLTAVRPTDRGAAGSASRPG